MQMYGCSSAMLHSHSEGLESHRRPWHSQKSWFFSARQAGLQEACLVPHSLFEQTLKGQRAAGSELFFFFGGGRIFSVGKLGKILWDDSGYCV